MNHGESFFCLFCFLLRFFFLRLNVLIAWSIGYVPFFVICIYKRTHTHEFWSPLAYLVETDDRNFNSVRGSQELCLVRELDIYEI